MVNLKQNDDLMFSGGLETMLKLAAERGVALNCDLVFNGVFKTN